MAALDDGNQHSQTIRLRVNKNLVSRSFSITHDLTIVGNGLKRTVIYLSTATRLFQLYSGNLKLKDLTVIVGANACLVQSSPNYAGKIEFDHVQIYHEPGLKKTQNSPDIELLGDEKLLPVKLECFDCQFDCIYAGVRSLELTHCLIGDLWGRSGLVGAYRGQIVKSVIANQRFEALDQGELDFRNDTLHGLLSLGGHIKLRHLTMQAPKAPTGWLVRRRLHKRNRIYRLPKAVNYIMGDDNCYLIQGERLKTTIDCAKLDEDGNSFKIWQKNAHLELNPRWFAIKDANVLLGNYDLPVHLNNQFVRCQLNGQNTIKKTKRPTLEPMQKWTAPRTQPKAKRQPVKPKSVHKIKPAPKPQAMDIRQLLNVLIGLMKDNHVLSAGNSASSELMSGLSCVQNLEPNRTGVTSFLQSCLDNTRQRIKTESPQAQQRDRKMLTYDDVAKAVSALKNRL